MPELPEVETIRRGLENLLPGKRITNVWHDWPKGFPNNQADVQQFMINAEVLTVRRRAKVLIIDLSTKYSILVHLKMTGQLVYVGKDERFGAGHPNDSLVGNLPDKSTRVIFTLLDGSHLFFNDQRKFGWVRLVPTVELSQLDFLKKIGPEPLAADFTPDIFAERLRRRQHSSIKPVLLDQTVIAGVGNIYADESLWGARIHPETRVKDISPVQLKDLYKSLRAVLSLSIEKGGSTDRNYVDAKGRKGSYLQFASVFRREGLACPRCGTVIIKTKVAGRGTHVCPTCQAVAS
jgi:formamidopyrimidine-DNA glycosylase